MKRTALAALTLAGLAACSTATDGSATPFLGTAFTERAGEVSLTDAIDDQGPYLAHLVATPDGAYAALLAGDSDGTVLVRLAPGREGLEVTGTVPLPAIDADSGLHVAADGTVAAVGTAEGEETGERLVFATIPPGAESAEVTDLEHGYGEYLPVLGDSALTSDGEVLYVSFGYEGDVPARVVAFDVATGEVLDDAEVDPGSGPGDHYAGDLALRSDGGVAVLVSAYDDGTDDDSPRGVLVEYDADLEPVGEPVTLLPDSEESITREVFVLPGGGYVAVAVDGVYQSSEIRLVIVRDGAVEQVHALDEVVDLEVVPEDVDLGPGGRYLYVPWTAGDDRTHGVTTVDLGTGEAVAEVPLCDGPGFAANVAVGAGGTELLAGGGCGEGDREELAVLLR